MSAMDIKKKVQQKSITQIHKKKIIVGILLVLISISMFMSILIENIIERKIINSIQEVQDKQTAMETEFESFKKMKNIEDRTIKATQKINKKYGFVEPISQEIIDNLASELKNALIFPAFIEIKPMECSHASLKTSKAAKCHSITISITNLTEDINVLNLDSFMLKSISGFVIPDKIEILKQSQYGDHIEYIATMSYKWIYFELLK